MSRFTPIAWLVLGPLLALALLPPSFADDARGARGALEGEQAGSIGDMDDVRRLVDKVIDDSFPELQGAEIRVKGYDSDSVFFRSRFTVGSFLFRRKKKLKYVIDVSERAFALKPPREAVEAILAHELAHTAFYHARKKRQLVGTLGIFFCKNKEVRFERATDLVTVSRGYGQGLKAYREWLYATIPAEKIANKKRVYLTPPEIDFVMAALDEDPELLEAWLDDPPTSLEAFRASRAALTRAP